MNTKKWLLRIWSAALGLAALAVAPSAFAIVTGAVWTTDVDGAVDRNIYTDKCDVYLSGGPKGKSTTALTDGNYYYQVTNPSGSELLSTAPAALRQVTVTGGTMPPIPLCDYADSIPTGEYKVWLVLTDSTDCNVTVNADQTLSVADSEGKPGPLHSCAKSDNFRIDSDPSCGDPGQPPCGCGGVGQPPCEECGGPEQPPCDPCANGGCATPFPPTISVFKTAAGLYDLDWSWSIGKTGCAVISPTPASCQTKVNQVGGTVKFQYTLTLTPGIPARTNNEVVGTIIVVATPGQDILANPIPVTGITLEDNIAFGIPLAKDEGATCVIDGEIVNDVLVLGVVPDSFEGTKVFGYHCYYAVEGPMDPVGETNQAVLRANSPAINPDTGGNEAEALAPFTFAKDQDIDGCVNVNDAFNGGLAEAKGQVCWDSAKTITYDRDITVPANGCLAYNNLASFSPTDTATATVEVCGPVKTGGLTIGFWQNKNGQDIIKYCNAGASNSLQTFLAQYNPFKNAPATCAALQKYVTDIIKAANASGAAMNLMLRAQMLATALNVYFSDPLLGGNKIGALSPVGAQLIDLTEICKPLATCAAFENTSSAFGGTPKTVSQLLTAASAQCALNPTGWCSSITYPWYAQDKPKQELAKDTFDAINNQKAFGP